VRRKGFAGMKERMFAHTVDGSVDEQRAECGKFRLNSTAVDVNVERNWNDLSTAWG
jgi:hypothetical protein